MNIYCTYLTIYQGNKLPPFYIGFSRQDKVHKGYHGSVTSRQYKSLWQKELQDHPYLFKTKILTIHQTAIEAKKREQAFQRAMNVIHNPLYINKAIGQNSDRTGAILSKETCEKIRLAHLGSKKDEAFKEKRRSYMIGNQIAKGNHKPKSEEHRRKIGLANKGIPKPHSEERKRQQSEAMKRYWANHRLPNRSCRGPNDDCHGYRC